MTKIVQKDDPVLRKKAKEVALKDIKTPKIQGVLEKMKKALDSQDDGVAIAAPQIGESLRIFMVSRKVFAMEQADKQEENYQYMTCINPKILKKSKETELLEEGCLSVRYLYGKVRRSKKVMLEALDENGKKISRGGSGLLAQIFQHETDHLDGILFIDTAVDVEDLPTAK